MPPYKAAWLTQPKTNTPLEVKEAPYTSPKANEVVVKVHAVAINPIDWLKSRQRLRLRLQLDQDSFRTRH